MAVPDGSGSQRLEGSKLKATSKYLFELQIAVDKGSDLKFPVS